MRSSFLRTFSSTASRTPCCSELLKDRAVLKIQRESCTEFLQGLITNDMNLLSSQKCIYTMLLNSKGRVLFDAFIYKTESPDEVLMECSSEISDAVIKHLKVYSLRKKIDVVRSKLSVWAVRKECSSNVKCECVPDPRCTDPWVYRCIADTQPTECVEEGTYSKLRLVYLAYFIYMALEENAPCLSGRYNIVYYTVYYTLYRLHFAESE